MGRRPRKIFFQPGACEDGCRCGILSSSVFRCRQVALVVEVHSDACDQELSPMGQTGKVAISVLVATYNEELHIAGCLASVIGWASEVFIVDSLSTDRTL